MKKNYIVALNYLKISLVTLTLTALLVTLLWDKFLDLTIGFFIISIILMSIFSFKGIKSGMRGWKVEERTFQLYLVLIGNLLILLLMFGIGVLFVLMIRGLNFK